MKYIVFALKRHGRKEYFGGYFTDQKSKIFSRPIIVFELNNAMRCTEEEANKAIDLLSGPYTKYQKISVEQ